MKIFVSLILLGSLLAGCGSSPTICNPVLPAPTESPVTTSTTPAPTTTTPPKAIVLEGGKEWQDWKEIVEAASRYEDGKNVIVSHDESGAILGVAVYRGEGGRGGYVRVYFTFSPPGVFYQGTDGQSKSNLITSTPASPGFFAANEAEAHARTTEAIDQFRSIMTDNTGPNWDEK